MFKKQTIHIVDQPIDTYTIKMLKKGERYKLFKLDIEIDAEDPDRLEVFYQMLDELPHLEICRISVKYCNNELLDTLVGRSMFETKQDLFKVLETSDKHVAGQSEPHEYLSTVYNPREHDMRRFVKQAKKIKIEDLKKYLFINCVADEVEISINFII